MGVLAVTAAGPGLRRGHVIYSDVSAVAAVAAAVAGCPGPSAGWPATFAESTSSSLIGHYGKWHGKRRQRGRFRRCPGRYLCLHLRAPVHRGQADRSAGPPAARAPEAARQHCTFSIRTSLQRATNPRRGTALTVSWEAVSAPWKFLCALSRRRHVYAAEMPVYQALSADDSR